MKTKGATSHIDVPLSVLVSQLPPTAKVRVARRWANTMGSIARQHQRKPEVVKRNRPFEIMVVGKGRQ